MKCQVIVMKQTFFFVVLGCCLSMSGVALAQGSCVLCDDAEDGGASQSKPPVSSSLPAAPRLSPSLPPLPVPSGKTVGEKNRDQTGQSEGRAPVASVAGMGGESIPMSTLMAARKAMSGQVGGQAAASSVVFPEYTTSVFVSNQAQNRFVCTTGSFGKVWMSDEKFTQIEGEDYELFVKFKYEIIGGEVNYMEAPVEMFLHCGDETYSIVMIPKSLPPQTLYLVSRTAKDKDDGYNVSSDVDHGIVQILKFVFSGDIPPSWSKQSLPATVYHPGNSQLLSLAPRRAYFIPGIDVKVSIFSLTTTGRNIPVHESMFIDPGIVRNPVAISVDMDVISVGETGTVVVLEKVYHGEEER